MKRPSMGDKAYLGQFGDLDFIQDTEAYIGRLEEIAPALLRELKAAIFFIETYGGEVTDRFSSGGNLDVVKALIRKAEGL